MPQPQGDDTGSLEKARKRLYERVTVQKVRSVPTTSDARTLPHEWEEMQVQSHPYRAKRHVRLALIFFVTALVFFLVSLGVVGYFFYFGGNTVSVDKVTVNVQGPTTIAGGDTTSLSLTITNKNPVAIDNATIEVGFPNGTRSADNVLVAYQRYAENLGTLASGETVTRSVKAVVFGGAGQVLTLPVSFSYETAGSNAVFVKKSSYALAVSSTPLSISVDTPSETVSGKPITFTLTVRSNAIVPLSNVVVAGTFPFGFSVNSSSLPLTNSGFLLGTIAPGATKQVSLVGTLIGQDKEQRVFHFTVGTANTSNDQTPAILYMTQDAAVTIVSPFINTTLAVNGDTSANMVVSPGSRHGVTVSYTNTLQTVITNATVAVAVSGSAVDYNSIQTTNGFYRSVDHTVVFSRDTDPALATLAPGSSGLGAFTFSTLPANLLTASPSLTFTVSVSGTRVGQTNVPEVVSASSARTVKVATAVAFSASSLHTSGALSNTGPVPPTINKVTTYSIVFSVRGGQNSIAGATATTILPGYVSFTGATAGNGAFSYDGASHTMSWNAGDLAQGASAQGVFQVSFIPSLSQRGGAPPLTGPVSFSGYDRFAGVQISATSDPVTTETSGDPGYVLGNATVQ